MAITQSNHTPDAIQQVHEQFSDVLRRQAEEIVRLLAVNGGIAASETTPGIEMAEIATEQADGDEAADAPPEATASPEFHLVEGSGAVPTRPAGPPVRGEKTSTASPERTPQAEEPSDSAKVVDAAHSIEEDERVLRDARQFSKLLVSEIELNHKNSVDEGRRNRDIYHCLKKDIDRSREIYEKRFAHTVARQFDYFHEEVGGTLAENDPLLLGSGYPGPPV